MFFQSKNTISARYWDDPDTFNPSRFLKDWPRDAFLPFSAGENLFFLLSKSALFKRLPQCAGARACIGRKYVDLTYSFPIKVLIAISSFFFSSSGSLKLKAQQY